MGKIAQAISHLLVAIVDLENLKEFLRKAKIAHATKKMDECIRLLSKFPATSGMKVTKKPLKISRCKRKLLEINF